MNKKPLILLSYAKNDLAGVITEAENIYNSVQTNNLVKSVKIEDADIDSLAETIIDNNEDLLMFHYGGHANQHNIVLDGFRNLDKIRLSKLLLPKENHNLAIIFLNGCLSYGHVGLLTAKGVKIIIATNVEVNDDEAVRLSKFFYKCFFEKNYPLKSAFESAEATVKGKNSFPIVVNPGEVDETQPMPFSWTLFVHSKHTEVLEWTLEDFIGDFQKKNKIGLSNNLANLEQYIYISESKLDMYISQLKLEKINNFKNNTNLFDKLAIFRSYYVNNKHIDNSFIEGELFMFCEVLKDEKHNTSYIYFGDVNGKIALFGSPHHMVGNSDAIKSGFSHEFSWYVSSRITEAMLSNNSNSPIYDRRYNNFSLHIRRVNNELGSFPQKFRFLAKPIYHFEDCVLATPIYVSF